MHHGTSLRLLFQLQKDLFAEKLVMMIATDKYWGGGGEAAWGTKSAAINRDLLAAS